MASVENRGNGKWRITISNGYDSFGKKQMVKRTIQIDKTLSEKAQKREAIKQANAMQTDFDRRILTDAKRITVAELAEEFLERHVTRRSLRQTSKDHYAHLLRGRIIPKMGKLIVQDVTRLEINRFYAWLDKERAKSGRSKTGKLSGTTKRHYHTCLHVMFQYAVRAGYIQNNPVDAVEAPRKDTNRTDFYEPEECAELLRVLDNLPEDQSQWRLFFYMSLYTAMRPGELVGLNWSDIDGEKLTVSAGSEWVKGEGTKRTRSPKTEASKREIILPECIVMQLRQHRVKQAEYRLQFGADWPEPDAVFTGREGKRLDKSSATQKFQKILREHNLRYIKLYGLRHTAATIMIAQGLNVRDVMERLGHSQASTTLDIYSHQFKEAGRHTTEAVSDFLDQARRAAK